MAPLTINSNSLDPDNTSPGHFPPDASATDFILLRVQGSLEPWELRELEARGVTILRWMRAADGSPTCLCKYQPSNLADLEALPFVKSAVVYHEDFVIHPSLKASAEDMASQTSVVRTKESTVPGEGLLCDVIIALHPGTSQSGHDVFTQLKSLLPADSDIEKTHASDILLRCWVPAKMLPALAAMDHVASVEPAYEEAPHTVKARPLVAIYGSAWRMGQTGPVASSANEFEGADQVVAVCDTGFDKAKWMDGDIHPGFRAVDTKGQIVSRIANTSYSSTIGTDTVLLDDDKGHGTHVAGCVLGSYAAGSTISNSSTVTGMAPAARVYVQVFRQTSNVDRIAQLQGANLGITIQNNSYGRKCETEADKKLFNYSNANDAVIDDEIFRDPDLLIIVSAGNEGESLFKYPEGSQALGVNRQINGQAATKNVLTVGASWSERNMKASTVPKKVYEASTCVEGQSWFVSKAGSGHFDRWSVSSFSSKGPTADNILKPDVVAPGVGILSTYSRKKTAQKAKTGFFKPGYCPYPEMEYMSGTSMAAPIVSGIAACVKEASMKKLALTPRGLALKAILVNSAIGCDAGSFWYLKSDNPKVFARGVLGAPPDNIQGHGLVHFRRCMDHIDAMSFTPGQAGGLRRWAGFVDTPGVRRVTPPAAPATDADKYKWSFEPKPEHDSFSVTLAYTDLCGAGLLNRIALQVFLEVRDANENVLRQIGPQPHVPPPPNDYATFPLSNDGAHPAPALEQGNVKKIFWTENNLGALAVGEKRVVRIEVIAEQTFGGGNRVPVSLAWHSQRGAP